MRLVVLADFADTHALEPLYCWIEAVVRQPRRQIDVPI